MGHYLKTFFITYLLLFTFASNSVAQETASRETLPTLNSNESDVCSDYIVDVRPDGHQIRNLWGLVEGYQIDIPGSGITRLELLFGVARPEYPEEMVLGTIGVGSARNLPDFEVLFDKLHVPLEFRFIEYPPDLMMLHVVQEAVRDGYGKLRDLGLGYDSKQRRPIDHVSVIQGDEFLVPLGRLDHIQDDDVFYVYSRGDYNACSSDVRGLTLARATVVRMDDTSSILAINVALGGSRSVQVGDVVELSHEIDFASRLQANTDFRTRSVLQFDVPNIYAFNDRRVWINVTADIKHFLRTEASDFGFRAAIKEK